MRPSVLLWSAVAVLVLMLATWLLSVRRKDASIVDIVWGLGFVLVAWVSHVTGRAANLRGVLLVVCTTVWGLRLAGYLARRNLGKGEDYRYRAMRKKHGDRFPIVSLTSVFLTQGALMLVVSLPLQLGQMRRGRDGFDAWIVAGVLVWVIGLAFEAVGDAQLARFKADPANAGKVMDRGLWAWTRHPNYFGDACVWVGLWLIAASLPLARWAVVGPIVMIVLLRRVSGVPMLEKTIGRRRPGYDEYVRRTSAFVPRPPRRERP